MASLDDYGARRTRAHEAQLTFQDACSKHAGLPPARMTTDLQAWDKWAQEHPSRDRFQREGSLDTSAHDYPTTGPHQHPPGTNAQSQGTDHSPDLGTAGTKDRAAHPTISSANPSAMTLTTPGEQTFVGPLTVNGVPFALDSHDLGLFSVEKLSPRNTSKKTMCHVWPPHPSRPPTLVHTHQQSQAGHQDPALSTWCTSKFAGRSSRSTFAYQEMQYRQPLCRELKPSSCLAPDLEATFRPVTPQAPAPPGPGKP
jgi:hypothetical protein